LESAIEQLPIDIDLVLEELLKSGAQIGQVASGVESFDQAYASQDFEIVGFCALARSVIIEEHRTRA
jgi:hypothetical protein